METRFAKRLNFAMAPPKTGMGFLKLRMSAYSGGCGPGE